MDDAAEGVPGGFVADLDLVERRDRRFILEHVATVGPVFGAMAWGEMWVCVVGTERCRRLLAAHRSALTPYTFDVSSLVPGGFMRQMAGEMHATYRGRSGDGLAFEGCGRAIVTGRLSLWIVACAGAAMSAAIST